MGKTHAICDAAEQRLADDLFSVVILGEQLGDGQPSDHTRAILGLPGDIGRDELLAALDAAGEASHHPLVIFIDAINERRPRRACVVILRASSPQLDDTHGSGFV